MKLKHFNLAFGSQLHKALSDESRVRIMYLLSKQGRMCISDIEAVLGFTQTKTSRHLIYLKSAGLVSVKKTYQWAFYQIKDELSDALADFLNYFEKDPVLKKDAEIFKTLYSNRELAVCKPEFQSVEID